MVSYVMNVLIVDDSPSCRDTLKQAFSGHAHSCQIFEASEGHEALQMCKTQSFDIIFLSIAMPVIDGLETIKSIRQHDPYVLIIALSHLYDDNILTDVLRAGVADFIREPYDAVLIEKRIYNYLSLANYRRFITGNYTSVSLFNEPVFKRAVVFHVACEDDLSEFWEFFITHYSINQNKLSSQKFFRTIKFAFDMVEVLSWQNKKTTVVYESNDTHSYITVGPTRAVNSTLLKDLVEYKMQSDGVDIEATFSELKFSLKFKKYADKDADESVTSSVPQEVASQVAYEKPIKETMQSKHAVETTNAALYIANFFEQDEINDLNEAILNLEVKLSRLLHSKMLPHEALEIAEAIEIISKAVISYNDFAGVAIAFKSLALDIQENVDSFVANSEQLTTPLMAFLDNLKLWEQKLFKDGVERFDFMNTILINDSQQITHTFCQRTGDNECRVDDIFF